MKYEANAGPPKGDHPTDRAINALPLPQYPIAPPVAAGSVDAPTWTSEAISCAYLPGAKQFVELEVHARLVADALAGQMAVMRQACEHDQAEFNRKWTEQKERAEKAEAELEDWSQSNRLDELQRGYNAALARAKELEALHDAAGRLIKAKGRYHTEKNYRALAGAYDAANAMRCTCRRCQPNSFQNNRMILCSTCGNKRCPHANDHQHTCTGSNEPGQPGSAY